MKIKKITCIKQKPQIALCTLGSLNWGAYRNPEELKRACKLLIRSLDNILMYQDFLSIQSENSNRKFRPLGVGITNLAYFLAKRNLKYGESDALTEVKSFMEHQAYYLTEASVELAAERGACESSSDTRYGQGIFPWELRAPGVNELTDFTPELDWENLRERMKTHGVRHATVSACPPVESSSLCINSTNGFEMPMKLIQSKDSKSGSLTQVVPDYLKLKNKYQLMWDQTDCLPYLKTCAVISAYVDQGMSTNTFYRPELFPDNKVPATLMAKNIMLATKWGIKSFYYNRVPKTSTKQLESTTTVDESQEEEICESCVL
jgi:ribonucleoside-diphosphate reductase alpha chain